MQIEGRNTTIEILKSHRKVDKILIQEHINEDEKINEIIARARSRNVRIEPTPKKKLDRMSSTDNHQGVIALAQIKLKRLEEYFLEAEKHRKSIKMIYIREAQLQENVGAIARSAEASGMDVVLIPPKLTLTPQMFRSSMGALANIHIVQESLFTTIKLCKDWGINVIAIETNGDKFHYEADLTGNCMLIIGGEDKSISQAIRKQANTVVKIPMRGKINSLNMSTAAAVVLFEKVRQESLVS